MATVKELEQRIDNLVGIVANVTHVDEDELRKAVNGQQTTGKANKVRKHINTIEDGRTGSEGIVGRG